MSTSRPYPVQPDGLLKMNIGLVGAAIAQGQKLSGVDMGPETLRQRGLVQELEKIGSWILDYGNVTEVSQRFKSEEEKTLQSWNQPNSIYHEIFKTAKLMTKTNDLAVFLGGDHSIALSTVSGALHNHPDLSVVWVDAHGDINTPQTSPSGNLHGMPLAGLLGLFSESQNESKWFKHQLKPEKVALVGVRDLDSGEIKKIKDLNITMYTSDEVHQLGMNEVMRRVLKAIAPAPSTPIHMSFDIDAVDPDLASATGIHVANGLNLEDLKALGLSLSKRQLVSMDLVEVNPLMANSAQEVDQTAEVIFQLLHWTLTGQDRLSDLPPIGIVDRGSEEKLQKRHMPPHDSSITMRL